MTDARARIRADLLRLMTIPGPSGHEDRVRRDLSRALGEVGLASRTDVTGNLIATLPGRAPSLMLFAHADSLGLVVRAVEPDGFLRVHRLGGVPERGLPSQAVLCLVGEGRDVPGVVALKSHHATLPEERGRVLSAAETHVDTGHGSRAAVEAAGIRIGTPVVYLPRALELAGGRVAGTSVDDRAGCAVLLEVARRLAGRERGPEVHLVFSALEEFNLRGAVVAARALRPAAAIQLDLMLATDTPDMAGLGEMRLGGGPGVSLYSFHGRGTLNGVIPHPGLARLAEEAAEARGLTLQRSAQVGVLTDLSHVQTVGEGVASLDLGFPMRGSHSSLEVCDLGDLVGLADLLVEAVGRLTPETLERP